MDAELQYRVTAADHVEALATAFAKADYGRRTVRTIRVLSLVGFGLCALAAPILASSPGLTGGVIAREGVAWEGVMTASIRDRGLRAHEIRERSGI